MILKLNWCAPSSSNSTKYETRKRKTMFYELEVCPNLLMNLLLQVYIDRWRFSGKSKELRRTQLRRGTLLEFLLRRCCSWWKTCTKEESSGTVTGLCHTYCNGTSIHCMIAISYPYTLALFLTHIGYASINIAVADLEGFQEFPLKPPLPGNLL